MKIKTIWQNKPYPNNWEFKALCEEGNSFDIAIKNDSGISKIGPSPKEVVLQGMATCSSVDIVSNLQKMRQPLQGLIVECDATQTETNPKVFKTCIMTYHVTGENINNERVAHCVQLSISKYCGVSTMIEKSGCHVTPKLIINGKEIEIWDPDNSLSNKLTKWLSTVSKKAHQGIALVTGASRGIGFALVNQLANNGYAVIPTSRAKTNYDNENIFESIYLDVTKLESILTLKKLLQKNDVKLNLLVHNAGVASLENEEFLNALNVNASELRHIYETNVFGLIETNNILLKIMNNNSTIAMVASTMGQKSRDSYTAASYRLSKRTVMQFAMQAALQIHSENQNIAILSLHPGSVQTDMNPNGQITTLKCAENIANLLDTQSRNKIKQKNGSFWVFNEAKNVWEVAE